MSEAKFEFDVVVVGGGATGLTAANVASHYGLSVLVVEKLPQVGGTSVVSGGQMWVPGNRLGREVGYKDSPEAVMSYIASETGVEFNETKVRTFALNAGNMVDFVEKHTEVRFNGDAIHSPDYTTVPAGSALGGRSVAPENYDGRRLGRHVNMVAPRRYFTLVMGMQIAAGEMSKFMKALRTVKDTAHVTKRILQHTWDMIRYQRPMTLTAGAALVGALLKSALDNGVQVWTSTPAICLLHEGNTVTGLRILRDGIEVDVIVTRGVILAGGGISHDAERMRAVFPHIAAGSEHLSAASRGNTGDGSRMAESLGARFRTYTVAANAAYAPIARDPRRPGPEANVPVFSLGSPGIFAVMRDGLRFANETKPYHDFTLSMLSAASDKGYSQVESFLICDHRCIRKYGVVPGLVRPWPYSLAPHIKSGLLIEGRTIEELANKAGIDPANLAETVRRMNQYAATGIDPDFGRGSTPYSKTVGDLDHKPNHSLGPIDKGPFYAVRMVPGHIGTYAGLETDEHARVQMADGTALTGLYAVGNDMANVLSGDYPGRGGTLGPGMTFAYIAARHAADVKD